MSGGEEYVKLLDVEDALERLRDNDQNLTHLEVGGLSSPIHDEGARAVAETLKANDKLRGLNLYANQIGADGARAIADALTSNETLEELDWRGNHIFDEGARAIADALKANSTLQELYLRDNGIGDEGARAIADALKANSTLQTLDLLGNGIGDEGARAIADALKANSTLQELYLRGNEICDEGARALADALKLNDTLKKMSLDYNSIGSEGAHAFAGAIRVNNTLADLAWCRNSGADLIEKMRRHKKEFEEKGTSFYFDVNDGSISDTKGTVWEAATGYGHELSFVHEALRDILDNGNKKAIKEIFDGTRNSNGSPLLHIAIGFDSDEAFEFCKLIVDEVGADFDTVVDESGRTARQIAEGNKRTTQWARSIGTFLKRYLIERKGLYESATCRVDFAVDVTKSRSDKDRIVAIKTMNDQEQFKRELEHRLGKNQKYAASGEDIDPDWNLFDVDHAVPLLRYHEQAHDGELHRCLVMPQGERNLDEIIRYEGIAGRDINAITFFAVDFAKALQHLHAKGVVHGDVKPRNIVRIHGDFKLIDFDASVRVGEPLTEKFSSGYLAPEVTQAKFQPKENLEDLQAKLEKLEEEIDLAKANGDRKTKRMKEDELRKVEDEIDLIKSPDAPACGESNCSADEKIDVWSYGVVLYEMLTGTCLFRCDNNDNLRNEEEERKLMSWEGITDDELDEVLKDCKDDGDLIQSAKDLLRKCLSPEGSRIKNFNQVLKHSFLNRKVIQLEDIKKESQEVKEVNQALKKVADRMDMKLDSLEGKVDSALAALSDMQDQFKVVSTTVSNILRNCDAPKLMCVVPDDPKKWWDWDFNALIGKTVKVVMVCPVALSVPRNGKNELMGYRVKLPRDWVKKYGPALKISLDVLKIACAVAQLIPGSPTLPNLTGVGKSTNVFKVMNENLKKYKGDDAPDLEELENMLGDKFHVKVPENTSSIPEETMKLIEASYKEVKQLAADNQDPDFFKTGLVKKEKDGKAEYVLDDDKIKSLYEEMGQVCVRLNPRERIHLGADFDAIAKEGLLRKKSRNKFKGSKWKDVYCVLYKNGLLIHYESEEERAKDPLGIVGVPKPHKVKALHYGDEAGSLERTEIEEGVFCVIYVDGSSQKFGGMEEGVLTPKQSASAWILGARIIFNTPIE